MRTHYFCECVCVSNMSTRHNIYLLILQNFQCLGVFVETVVSEESELFSILPFPLSCNPECAWGSFVAVRQDLLPDSSKQVLCTSCAGYFQSVEYADL